MRRLRWIGGVVAFGVVVALGLSSIHHPSPAAPANLTYVQEQSALRGSRPVLARLHAGDDRLQLISATAVHETLASLRGTPTVVVKWASWCGPCLQEWPHIQRVATRAGRRVAFVGLDVDDVDADARALLRRLPVPFPSYSDPTIAIAYGLHIPAGQPIVSFFDARGRLRFWHEGPFTSDAALAAEVRRIERL